MKRELFSYEFYEELCTPSWETTTLTVPGSIQARGQVFSDGLRDFLHPANLPKHNPMLNSIEQFAADLLLSCKSQIENYNKNLMQKDNIEYSSLLEKWPTLSEMYLARLSLWLIKDTTHRIGLAVELSLDLDPEIVDYVMGWKNDREEILKEAKSVFITNYEFFQQHMRDMDLPHYLLSALLDEELRVPSCKELNLIKTDLIYCHTLVEHKIH